MAGLISVASSREARQVSNLVLLPAGRLKQNRGADTSMDSAESILGICVQRSRVRLVSGEIRVDGNHEPGFPELSYALSENDHFADLPRMG